MSVKVSAYVAASLDGYIASEGGDVQWLNEFQNRIPPGEDCGYAEFIETVDVLVMGRKTLETVMAFEKWPYGDLSVIAMSSNPIEFPAWMPEHIERSSEQPEALCRRLAGNGVEHIYVDGGVTIQSFLQAGLVNELIITLMPVLLGKGVPLFGVADSATQLRYVSSKAYEFGFVQLRYSTVK